MKKVLAIALIILSGCAELEHGQTQPVKLVGNNKYFTTCAGAVEDWSSCYQKARETCPSGYITISTADNNRGTQRDLTFQCKK